MLLLAIGCALTTPESASQVRDREQDTLPSASAPGGRPESEPLEIPYEVTMTGLDQTDLTNLLEAVSQLMTLQELPPPTLTALRRRAESDLERLNAALRSEGYYESNIRYEIDEDADPVTVRIEVKPGPQYRLSAFNIVYQGPPERVPANQPTLRDVGIETGVPARAPAIVAAQRRLLDVLAERGYPFSTVKEREAVINSEERTMSVVLLVEAGPQARFGPVLIEGLEDVDSDHVRALLNWERGEIYDRRKVEATRRELAATGLFSGVTIKPADELSVHSELPMTLRLTEGDHRSVGTGVKFDTDIGPAGEIFWEHRNSLGRNEKLRVSLDASRVEQSAKAQFRKPHFWRRDQSLLADTALTNFNTKAFSGQSASGSLGLERPWFEQWRIAGRVSGEYSYLKDKANDNAGRRSLVLFGLPLSANRDAADHPLNPTRGTRLNVTLTPFVGKGVDSVQGSKGGENLSFVTAALGGSAYYAIDTESRFILAGRAKIGALVGESRASVPADKRFYAGGGGSIRGYQFQRVGPLDGKDDPLGGRSLLEVGVETRIRITETIGVVPFVDGGTVYESPYPNFDETFRWAAGLGLRYFTGVGPLRLDIAVPLNRRRGIDESFQFYVSIGQAF